jgi:predicted Fe-Mo cluster-binding NifX family protein
MIRIAVPAGEDKGLDSMVSPHIWSCPYFVLVDFEERRVKMVHTVPNPHNGQPQRRQVPGFIHCQHIDVMFAGGMEEPAFSFPPQYGIQAMTGVPGTVRHTLEQYVGYRLEEANSCQARVERE